MVIGGFKFGGKIQTSKVLTEFSPYHYSRKVTSKQIAIRFIFHLNNNLFSKKKLGSSLKGI